jgi:hypothetical protein
MVLVLMAATHIPENFPVAVAACTAAERGSTICEKSPPIEAEPPKRIRLFGRRNPTLLRLVGESFLLQAGKKILLGVVRALYDPCAQQLHASICAAIQEVRKPSWRLRCALGDKPIAPIDGALRERRGH